MDEATERAKLAAEDKVNRDWWAREQKLCTCGAAGTLEGHAEECDAAKDYNRPGNRHRTISKGRGP